MLGVVTHALKDRDGLEGVREVLAVSLAQLLTKQLGDVARKLAIEVVELMPVCSNSSISEKSSVVTIWRQTRSCVGQSQPC
jgi:hypothetical protein